MSELQEVSIDSCTNGGAPEATEVACLDLDALSCLSHVALTTLLQPAHTAPSLLHTLQEMMTLYHAVMHCIDPMPSTSRVGLSMAGSRALLLHFQTQMQQVQQCSETISIAHCLLGLWES
jgi:hypothetical protein